MEFNYNRYHSNMIRSCRKSPIPAIICADGFKISVQASDYAYCEPRVKDAFYTLVEAGYPSELPSVLSEYAETPDTTETVFGWVPVGIINRLIDSHGGIRKEDEHWLLAHINMDEDISFAEEEAIYMWDR